jgi:hypothetical protein
VAITVGGFILVWFVSGIVMMLPGSSPGYPEPPPAVNFTTITVSPGDAIRALPGSMGTPADVRDVKLGRLLDKVVYEVRVNGGTVYLIDAKEGVPFTITQDVAERIARQGMRPGVPIRRIDHVTKHGVDYPWGPLPIYKVLFDDERATAAYVEASNGSVRFSDRPSRIRNAIASLHEFMPLMLIIDSEKVRKGLLILLSLVGVSVALSGYYLAFGKSKNV